MRAVAYDRYGPPEVLRLVEVERPVPSDDEVLLRVHASTVNRTDCGIRRANPFVVRFVTGLLRPKRKFPGSEFAGIVEAVGDSVREFEVGDAVFGVDADLYGAHADDVCVRQGAPLAREPDGMGFEEAAAVCDGATLALASLRQGGLPGRCSPRGLMTTPCSNTQSSKPIPQVGMRPIPEALRARTRMSTLVLLAFAVLTVFALCSAGASAQNEDSRRGPTSAVEFDGFLDRVMSAEMQRLDIPGAAVAVVRDGEVFFLKGYGFADRDNEIAVDPSTTLFRIGSVSKPLTALAALQQVERGNLDLGADVNAYLDFGVPQKDGTAVTLASLLTHTSGFEERRIGLAARNAADVQPLGEFLRKNVPARFAPTGEVHSYTNLGYAFVGHLVEQASGRDFARYMDESVFGPLGMQSTSFAQPLPAELESRLAVGYIGSSGSRKPADRAYDRDYPASGAASTAADMGRFMIALLEHGQVNGSRVVSHETAAAYLAPAYRPDPTVPGRTTGGLEELWINGEKAVGHGGDTLSSAAQMILLPEHRTGYFLAYNTAVDEFRENVMRAILDRYYPDRRPEPTFVKLSPDELKKFAGKYRWTRFARSKADKILAWTPPYNTTVDANADGTLTIWWLGVGEHWRYRPTSLTTFTKVSGERAVVDGLVLDPGDRISFSVENGHVTYLHTSLHTVALERVPVYLWGIVQVVAYLAIFALFLVSLIVWPVGALIRRRRGQPGTSGWARGALWLVVGVALTVTLATVALFLGLSDDDVVYGATPTIYAATGLITIASTAGLLLIPAAAGAWRKRWFTIGGRLYYSVLALAVPVLLWWAIYWHLIGFQF